MVYKSIPRDYVAAMLDELTIEANEESFVIVHQHGGNDVTCKSRISKESIGRPGTRNLNFNDMINIYHDNVNVQNWKPKVNKDYRKRKSV